MLRSLAALAYNFLTQSIQITIRILTSFNFLMTEKIASEGDAKRAADVSLLILSLWMVTNPINRTGI
jgi:hypothetical protein